ncbi:MAG: helix-turn-helix transcriptional regulator [Oscillospiraceae bacterium]
MEKRNLPDRYADLRVEHGITQTELAKKLGLSKQGISFLESGARKLSAETLNLYADFFDVSTDYLLGRTDVRTTNVTVNEICKYTGLSEKALAAIVKLNKEVEESHFDNHVQKKYNHINALNYFLGNEDFVPFSFLISQVYQICKPDVQYNYNESNYIENFNNLSSLVPLFLERMNSNMITKPKYAAAQLVEAQNVLWKIFYDLIIQSFSESSDK